MEDFANHDSRGQRGNLQTSYDHLAVKITILIQNIVDHFKSKHLGQANGGKKFVRISLIATEYYKQIKP